MPTNLYGPGDKFDKNSSHVMASFIKVFNGIQNSLPRVTCWGTGKPMREFMHVDDLEKQHLLYWKTGIQI